MSRTEKYKHMFFALTTLLRAYAFGAWAWEYLTHAGDTVRTASPQWATSLYLIVLGFHAVAGMSSIIEDYVHDKRAANFIKLFSLMSIGACLFANYSMRLGSYA